MKSVRFDRLTVRGHTLLCLQGFRGEGYSPDFVENLSAIHRLLTAFPEKPVEVVQAPDSICASCPNLKSDGCHLKGPGSEAEMMAQDKEVMGRLDIPEGAVLPWQDILHRISGNIQGGDLAGICGGCQWLPSGYCKKGIEALKGSIGV